MFDGIGLGDTCSQSAMKSNLVIPSWEAKQAHLAQNRAMIMVESPMNSNTRELNSMSNLNKYSNTRELINSMFYSFSPLLIYFIFKQEIVIQSRKTLSTKIYINKGHCSTFLSYFTLGEFYGWSPLEASDNNNMSRVASLLKTPRLWTRKMHQNSKRKIYPNCKFASFLFLILRWLNHKALIAY